MEHALLPVAGFFIGIIASMTGVGGGIFIVPLLTIGFGFIPQQAIGTSLGSIIFTALASTYSYARQRRIFYRAGLLMAAGSIPGAYFGAYLTTVVSSRLLGGIFSIFLLFVAGRMVLSNLNRSAEVSSGAASGASLLSPPQDQEKAIISVWAGIRVLALGFVAGLGSGFLGIGGGVLAVPAMNFGLQLPIHNATATSMFMMIFTSFSGALKHTLAEHLRWSYALLLALGTIFGAQVGAGYSRRVSAKTLRRVFGVIMIVVSIQMLLKFF